MELAEVTVRPPSGILGQRFGRLVVEEVTSKRRQRALVYRCLCDCGESTLATKSRLDRGRKQSCGCLGKEWSQALADRSRQNLCGKRFGRWRVLSKVVPCVDGNTLYVCWCDCGQAKQVRGSNLSSGRSRSCGCYAIEQSSQRIKNLNSASFRGSRKYDC